MFVHSSPVTTPSFGVNHKFDRSIIFIPKWLENRVRAYSKNEKTLKDIQGLFSILIPADVSFYLKQVSAIASHPAVRPYFESFNMYCHVDEASWGANISSQKASKKYQEIMEKVSRGGEANNTFNYLPIESYVENNTSASDLAMPVQNELPFDRAELAGILGVNPDNPTVDLFNLRVVIDELDADTLIMRLETLDPNQSKISQVLKQTEANIKKFTQYYEFNKVTATPVGKLYFRLVLSSPNS